MHKYHAVRFAPALVLLACLAAATHAPAAQAAAVTAQFDGELLVAEGAPAFAFSGTVLAASDKMRIEVTQQATQEQALMLVDFAAGQLTILYPDTLNGQRYNLEEFDYLQGFARIRDALAGEGPDLPAGWKETANEDRELDGTKCNYRSALSPKGLVVELWTGADHRPLRATATRESLQVVINAHDFAAAASLDESVFAIPEDYTITEAEGGVPEGLPQL